MTDFLIILRDKLASTIEQIDAGVALKLVLGRLRVEVYWIAFVNRPAA
jgi:hypothetical protein